MVVAPLGRAVPVRRPVVALAMVAAAVLLGLVVPAMVAAAVPQDLVAPEMEAAAAQRELAVLAMGSAAVLLGPVALEVVRVAESSAQAPTQPMQLSVGVWTVAPTYPHRAGSPVKAGRRRQAGHWGRYRLAETVSSRMAQMRPGSGVSYPRSCVR